MGFLGWLLTLGVAAFATMWATRALRYEIVREHDHALRFEQGRFDRILPPGGHWVLSPPSALVVLEGRPVATRLPREALLCADGATIDLGLVLETRVTDPKLAVFAAADAQATLAERARLALHDAVAERSAAEICADRRGLADAVRGETTPAAEALGLELRLLAVVAAAPAGQSALRAAPSELAPPSRAPKAAARKSASRKTAGSGGRKKAAKKKAGR